MQQRGYGAAVATFACHFHLEGAARDATGDVTLWRARPSDRCLITVAVRADEPERSGIQSLLQPGRMVPIYTIRKA